MTLLAAQYRRSALRLDLVFYVDGENSLPRRKLLCSIVAFLRTNRVEFARLVR